MSEVTKAGDRVRGLHVGVGTKAGDRVRGLHVGVDCWQETESEGDVSAWNAGRRYVSSDLLVVAARQFDVSLVFSLCCVATHSFETGLGQGWSHVAIVSSHLQNKERNSIHALDRPYFVQLSMMMSLLGARAGSVVSVASATRTHVAQIQA